MRRLMLITFASMLFVGLFAGYGSAAVDPATAFLQSNIV